MKTLYTSPALRRRFAAATALLIAGGALAACSPVEGAGAPEKPTDPATFRSAMVDLAEHPVYSADGKTSAKGSDFGVEVDHKISYDGKRYELDLTLREAQFDGKKFEQPVQVILNGDEEFADAFIEFPEARKVITYAYTWAQDNGFDKSVPDLKQLEPGIKMLENGPVSLLSGDSNPIKPEDKAQAKVCSDAIKAVYADKDRLGKAYDDLTATKLIKVTATATKDIGGESSQGFTVAPSNASERKAAELLRNTSLAPVVKACYDDMQSARPSASVDDSAAASDDKPLEYTEDTKVNLYVGLKSGQFTGAQFGYGLGNESSLTTLTFGRDKVDIKRPTSSVKLDDVIKALSGA